MADLSKNIHHFFYEKGLQLPDPLKDAFKNEFNPDDDKHPEILDLCFGISPNLMKTMSTHFRNMDKSDQDKFIEIWMEAMALCRSPEAQAVIEGPGMIFGGRYKKKSKQKTRRKTRRRRRHNKRKRRKTRKIKGGELSKLDELKIQAKIAAALRETTEDDNFSQDAIELLQELYSTNDGEEEEEGLDEDSLKLISDSDDITYYNNPMFLQEVKAIPVVDGIVKEPSVPPLPKGGRKRRSSRRRTRRKRKTRRRNKKNRRRRRKTRR